MPLRKQMKISTPVQPIKHKDKRANIPTEELRDIVADEEATPKTMLLSADHSKRRSSPESVTTPVWMRVVKE